MNRICLKINPRDYFTVLPLIVMLQLLSFAALSQTLTTYAGTGIEGYMDGPADDAVFFEVEQLAVDQFGNTYVADSENHAIRKISVDGIVSTLAGTGVSGFQNGPGVQAQFNFPLGVAVDNEGNVFVADNNNFCIRQIDPNGMVSTLAGGGGNGYFDGPLETAQFNEAVQITVDKNGLIYVADHANERIRTINRSTGMVSTLAGSGVPGFSDGPAAEAQFSSPRGVAVDDDLNVYVGDQTNNAIRKISADGMVTTLAGTGTSGHNDGAGETARFNGPKGVCLDSLGNVYVADRLNFVVRKIDAITGEVSTVAGIPGFSGYDDGTLENGLIGRAVAVVSLNNNCLLIADWENSVVRKAQFGPSVSTQEINEVPFTLYPNPVKDVLTIKGEFENVSEIIFRA